MSTEPTLGWVALSRTALAAAEKHLADQQKGVRDEAGVLTLHSGYANRFFPGTSVQHTRVRYVYFLAWQLDGLLRDTKVRRGQARVSLADAEKALALRLSEHEPVGVIGANTARKGRLTSIPPSSAYWSSLGAWELLRDAGQGPPALSQVFDQWNRWAERTSRKDALSDDEHGRLARAPHLLAPLPAPPKAWSLPSKRLDFTLNERERQDLCARLIALRRDDGGPTLLARLVQAGVVPGGDQQPWDDPLRQLADAADQAALLHARDAASVAALLRGLYNALVETVRDEVDHISKDTDHRVRMEVLRATHSAAALRFRPAAAARDGLDLGGLATVIEKLQAWLAVPASTPMDARPWLARWESIRKGERARLPRTRPAALRRLDWSTSPAGPIEYRWGVVRGILQDLGGDDGAR